MLCRVYCQRTIKRKLNSKQNSRARAELIAAFCNRRTKTGAIKSTNNAIRLAKSPESANYIKNYWLANIEKWANYARDYSALLLQITTTNPIKAFHRSLKSFSKLTKLVIRPKYFIAKIISLISQCAFQYNVRA